MAMDSYGKVPDGLVAYCVTADVFLSVGSGPTAHTRACFSYQVVTCRSLVDRALNLILQADLNCLELPFVAWGPAEVSLCREALTSSQMCIKANTLSSVLSICL